MEHPVVLFDGVCNLCNAVVSFIIERDRAGRYRFASLQGRAGARLLRAHGMCADDVDSVLLVDGGQVYARSTAALRIARGLGWPWALLGVFCLVPPFLRDRVYDLVARRRYAWFGRSDSCRVPLPHERERFLD